MAFTIDPNTMGGWSLLGQGLGTAMSAVGAFSQAQQQKAALNYEAAIAANNATLAGYQAQVANQVGQQEQMTSNLRTGQVFGAQRAALAANGVDLGEGSATDVLATTKFMGTRDALTIADDTAQRVWAIQSQQAGYANEAMIDRSTAGNLNPMLSGASSLLGNAGKVAASWYSMKKQGINPTL